MSKLPRAFFPEWTVMEEKRLSSDSRFVTGPSRRKTVWRLVLLRGSGFDPICSVEVAQLNSDRSHCRRKDG
jgi:hypothetical protein